jgi:hypothetical protein
MIFNAQPRGGSVIEGNEGVAVGPVTGIETKAGTDFVSVKWTDPEDFALSGTTIAKWAGTLLVRKEGSPPTNANDGAVVLDSKTRNAYQNDFFSDKGLMLGTTYYYKFYPYTETGTHTYNDTDAFSATPNYAPVDETSWADIGKVSAAGIAPNVWAVGDCKGITVNGTVGTLSINQTLYVFIIGFNHNGATNTVDWQGFKTAASKGVDVCLIDSNYNSTGSSGTKYFNMNHWGTDSSPYNTNYGGWKGCDARYDILGSTNQAPSGYGSTATTSRTGYDATSTCATSPVSNTLMAALPSDLRAVMKPMTIYTDNTGNAANTAACVTTSVDYLPLLAEYEIFGARSYANSYEQNYQAQYDYYKAGNSKVKYRHSSTGSAAWWWERSPNYSGASTFCYVSTNGGANYDHSRYSYGLAPAFRV